MENGGNTRQSEIPVISLDSDEEEAFDCSGEEKPAELEYEHGFVPLGNILDVENLSEQVLKSIVTSIMLPTPKTACQTCVLLKNAVLRLNHLDLETRASKDKMKQLEKENAELRSELEKEKKERGQLEKTLEQMGKNLEKLQEITGNIRTALHVEQEQDNNNNPPQVVEKDPRNLEEFQASTPKKAEAPPQQPQPLSPPYSHFHLFDKSKAHLGSYCVCGLQFRTKGKVLYHVKRKLHESIGKAQFTCSQCPRTFRRFEARKRHLKLHHGLQYVEGAVGCHYCGQVFQTRIKMLYHQRITQ